MTHFRLLFVRLLALVKWASSATKVDKCNQIMAYLERQSQLFTETADSLAQMARYCIVLYYSGQVSIHLLHHLFKV